jgi:integrase/recombinase XerD
MPASQPGPPPAPIVKPPKFKFVMLTTVKHKSNCTAKSLNRRCDCPTVFKVNKAGKATIFLRITLNQKSAYVHTGIIIEPRHFNPDKEEIRDTKDVRDNATLNMELYDRLESAKRAWEYLKAAGEAITAEKIKAVLIGKYKTEDEKAESEKTKRSDFFSHAERVIREASVRGCTLGTIQNYESTIRRFREYVKKCGLPTIAFEEIDLEFLSGFKKFLTDCGPNTIMGHFTIVKRIIKSARESGIIPPGADIFTATNVYKKLGLKKLTPTLTYLSPEQIHKLESLELKPHSTIWHVRNWYLFAVYSGGMRFSDVGLLRWVNYRDGKLYYTQRKTGKVMEGIPVMPPAADIIKLYKKDTNEPDNFIFNIFDSRYDYTNPELYEIKTTTRNNVANKYLKEISVLLGLGSYNKKTGKFQGIKLKFHSSRHTFANLAASKGIPMYVIMMMLGHSNLKTTETYLERFSKKAVTEGFETLLGEWQNGGTNENSNS